MICWQSADGVQYMRDLLCDLWC